MTTATNASDIPTPRLTRIPGRARPRTEALREARDQVRRQREGMEPALWSLFAPGPEKHYRWRVQLDCDCIVELYTYGEYQLPHEASWLHPSTGFCLPKGQVPCYHPSDEPAPYRLITKWIRRREMTFPADPTECPSDKDPVVWEIIHSNEPRTSAFWTVELECGHTVEVCASVGWDPAEEPMKISGKRQAEMTAEIEELWRDDPPPSKREAQDRDHHRRMLAQGWPMPFPERDCWSCLSARRIVAYQAVGWLVPRPKPVAAPAPNKAGIQRRLEKAEAEAQRLRKQLKELD